MTAQIIYTAIAAAIVASLGLWWFRVVLASVRRMPKTTRYGIYALIWLAYFILTLLLVSNAQQ